MPSDYRFGSSRAERKEVGDNDVIQLIVGVQVARAKMKLLLRTETETGFVMGCSKGLVVVVRWEVACNGWLHYWR